MTPINELYINAVSVVSCRSDILCRDKLEPGYHPATEPDIRMYLSPVKARRMSKLLRRALCTSLDVLHQCGITSPDAIITATAMGCWQDTELFLDEIIDNHEELLKPTRFMQSTHNTPGSTLAIHLGCHGYNNTWSDGDRSFISALNDTRLLLSADDTVHNVLLGSHDELTDFEYKQMTANRSHEAAYSEASVAMLISKEPLSDSAVTLRLSPDINGSNADEAIITTGDIKADFKTIHRIEDTTGLVADPLAAAIALTFNMLNIKLYNSVTVASAGAKYSLRKYNGHATA